MTGFKGHKLSSTDIQECNREHFCTTDKVNGSQLSARNIKSCKQGNQLYYVQWPGFLSSMGVCFAIAYYYELIFMIM